MGNFLVSVHVCLHSMCFSWSASIDTSQGEMSGSSHFPRTGVIKACVIDNLLQWSSKGTSELKSPPGKEMQVYQPEFHWIECNVFGQTQAHKLLSTCFSCSKRLNSEHQC